MLTRALLVAGIMGSCYSAAWSQSDVFSVERYVWPVDSGELRVQLTITGDEATINTIQAIGIQETHPEEWAYTGYYEEYYGPGTGAVDNRTSNKEVSISPRDGYIDFYWIEVPAFPITLVYGLTYSGYMPDDALSGTLFILTAAGELQVPSPVTPIQEISCLALDRELQSLVYVPGQDLSVQLRIDNYCEEPLDRLDVYETWDIPATLKSAGIAYPGSEGEVPQATLPEIGLQPPYVFQWAEPPVFPLVINYVLTLPGATTGLIQVAGEAHYSQGTIDITATVPAQNLYGDNPDNVHPADTNQDWRITMDEAIQYVSGWQLGTYPMNYAIRALYLWQRGEYYRLTDATPPLCWELR